MRQIWVVSFTHGKANLDMVEVERETPKLLWTPKGVRSVRMLGWQYVPRQLRKDGLNWFDTPEEAMEWLVEAAKGHMKSCQMEVGKALAEQKKLVALLAELKKDEKEGGEGDPDHG